ncbi:MAG: hypothetical protein FJX76_09630 [Armatimonadetes bacterium]|nr:hypothetical protein [Armatimonadota bacterium]
MKRAWIAALIVSAALLLLFYNLGHYALWDDEALTALTALGVWETGDTTVRVGNNVVAYRGGAMIDGFQDRFSSPLQFYLAAPFLGILGPSPLAARLPFALCGFLGILLGLRWMWRSDLSPVALTVFGIALLCTVEVFLFFRQCRYYAPAMLFTLALAYVWVEWTASRWYAAAVSALLCLLWLSSFLNLVAAVACLLVDHALWGKRITAREILIIVLPPALLCALTLTVWNPLPRLVGVPLSVWLASKATLLLEAYRDLDRNEFFPGLLMLAAPLVAWWRAAPLMRPWCAVMVYVAAVTIASPQYRGFTADDVAFIRFYAPVLALTIPLGAMTILALANGRWLAIPLAVLAFGTTWLHPAPAQKNSPSTIALFVDELRRPPSDPYTVASRWLNDNLTPGTTVWAMPPHAMYPLMFSAPRLVYGWQLQPEKRAQYPTLDSVHFFGLAPVDTIVAFADDPVLKRLPWRYERVATLPVLGRDLFRPEIEWRTFREVPIPDPALGIQIYERR